MPIRPQTIQEHGFPFLQFQSTDTLFMGLDQVQQQHLPLNRTFLVFQSPQGQWFIASIFDTITWLEYLGSSALDMALMHLPFDLPNRIEQTNRPGSGLEVINWLAGNPGSTVLILEDERVAGVFANPIRADESVNRTILNRLHGPEATLWNDIRLIVDQDSSGFQCPNCQTKTQLEYERNQKVYRCKACQAVVVTQ